MRQDMFAEQLEVKSIGGQADKIPVILLEAFKCSHQSRLKQQNMGFWYNSSTRASVLKIRGPSLECC